LIESHFHYQYILAGCCKSEFDSTYPIHLNGIISQAEFQESIENINQTGSSRKLHIFVEVISLLCILCGIALFIAGGIKAASSHTYRFPVLVSIGFGVFFLGMIILIIGCCIIQSRRTVKMQQAIANESKKYSFRSTSIFSARNDVPPPHPCNGLPSIGFCTHCGMPQQNPTPQFCSSCDQSLNMF
jgi:hypothetical protein